MNFADNLLEWRDIGHGFRELRIPGEQLFARICPDCDKLHKGHVHIVLDVVMKDVVGDWHTFEVDCMLIPKDDVFDFLWQNSEMRKASK